MAAHLARDHRRPDEPTSRPARRNRAPLRYADRYDALARRHHPAVAAILADDWAREEIRRARRRTRLRLVAS